MRELAAARRALARRPARKQWARRERGGGAAACHLARRFLQGRAQARAADGPGRAEFGAREDIKLAKARARQYEQEQARVEQEERTTPVT